jgi:hypothetical protein
MQHWATLQCTVQRTYSTVQHYCTVSTVFYRWQCTRGHPKGKASFIFDNLPFPSPSLSNYPCYGSQLPRRHLLIISLLSQSLFLFSLLPEPADVWYAGGAKTHTARPGDLSFLFLSPSPLGGPFSWIARAQLSLAHILFVGTTVPSYT